MKDRVAPCQHYICKGECTKGYEAEQKGICQHCDKYLARKGFKTYNKRKEVRDNCYGESIRDIQR